MLSQLAVQIEFNTRSAKAITFIDSNSVQSPALSPVTLRMRPAEEILDCMQRSYKIIFC
jgi:hypothetical protein